MTSGLPSPSITGEFSGKPSITWPTWRAWLNSGVLSFSSIIFTMTWVCSSPSLLLARMMSLHSLSSSASKDFCKETTQNYTCDFKLPSWGDVRFRKREMRYLILLINIIIDHSWIWANSGSDWLRVSWSISSWTTRCRIIIGIKYLLISLSNVPNPWEGVYRLIQYRFSFHPPLPPQYAKTSQITFLYFPYVLPLQDKGRKSERKQTMARKKMDINSDKI